MRQAFVLTGSIHDEHTVTLDEALPLAAGKVRLVVEVLADEQRPALSEVLRGIHEEQRKRGFVPPTREEVDAYLKAERES